MLAYFEPPDHRDGVAAVVLYHKDCSDGFGAYYVAQLELRKHYREVIGLPIAYDGVIPDFYDWSDVYIVDFCFKENQRSELEKLASRSMNVTVIDHHASGQWLVDFYRGNVTVVFDLEFSGAQLAWAYFCNRGVRSNFPELINYIADRDLWRNALPNTYAVSAAVRMAPKTLEAWDGLWATQTDITAWALLLVRGETILSTLQEIINDVLRAAVVVPTPMGLMGMTVCPRTVASDACHQYLVANPAVGYAAAFILCGDRIEVSLRSREGGVLVHEIAHRFGGGGHPCAAGFSVPCNSEVFPIGTAMIVAQQKLMQDIVTVTLVNTPKAAR